MTSEYNALDRMRQSDGRDGRSPVSELKLVKYDAFVDANHIEQAIEKAGNSFIRGPLQQELFSIMKYDLLLSWKLTKQWRSAQVGEETTLRVFSVLNGLGSPKDSRFTLLNRLRCAGFAGTPTREDSTGQAPKRDLPVVLGGLYNAWNTGPEVITQGDWVYWDLPESDTQINDIQGGKYNQGRPKDRYLALLRPYDPKKQSMNVEMLRYFNVDAAPHSNHGDFRNDFADWSKDYANSARGLMFLGAMMAASGLFGDMQANGAMVLGEDDLINRMRTALSTTHKAFAERVTKDLGLIAVDERVRERGGNGDNNNNNNKKADNIKRVANRLMFPSEMSDRLVPRVWNTGETLTGVKKTVARIQSSAVKINLRSGEEVRQFVKGRIVGKAMESVGPGDFFDITIGSYAI